MAGKLNWIHRPVTPAWALLLLLAGCGPLSADDTPLLDLQISGRNYEMTEQVKHLFSQDLEIFGYGVTKEEQAPQTAGIIRLKITTSLEKTGWRGEGDVRAVLRTRRLVLKGWLRCSSRRHPLLEEDVAGCFLTEQDSSAGGMFQRTQRTAEGVWMETDTSLIMRMIRRLEIEIFSAMSTEQSARALLAVYWQFPDRLGSRVMDAVRLNRKTFIPVLEALYASAEGSEKAAAAAILSRYSD